MMILRFRPFVYMAAFVACSMLCYISALKSMIPSTLLTTLRAAATPDVVVTNLDNNSKISIPTGAPLSLAAVRSGMRLSFQCKQGVCSSCETMLDGKRVRTCITKVPEKKSITIQKAKPK